MASPPSTRDALAPTLEGAGAVIVFIGAYAPWVVTVALLTPIHVRGVDTDFGRILPPIPLLGLGVLAWRWYTRRSRGAHLAFIALGVLTLALALFYANGVKHSLAQAQQSLSRSGGLPGAVTVRLDLGMYLTIIGATAMLAGGALGSAPEKTPRTPRAQ